MLSNQPENPPAPCPWQEFSLAHQEIRLFIQAGARSEELTSLATSALGSTTFDLHPEIDPQKCGLTGL